ncbi:MAG: alanine racemase [Pseudomonadota bacterium]
MQPFVEINLTNLCANYRTICDAAPNALAAAVVKCDGYGLGAGEISRCLYDREGCRVFFVAYPEEGVSLRRDIGNRSDVEIFVFHGPTDENFSLFAEANLVPVINTLRQAKLWSDHNQSAPCALHFDTGLNRLGLSPAGVPDLLNSIKLKPSWVMSHLTTAAVRNAPSNAEQFNSFVEVASNFPDAKRSLASSAGALIAPEFGLDMIRIGVALYGVNPLDDRSAAVLPVARLCAQVISTGEINGGETVGYNRTFTATRPTRLATLSIGYGDGLIRAGGGTADKPKAKAYIGGAPCPIVGRISMDLIVVDTTDAPNNIAEGDIAELFGPNLSIDDQAAASRTIGYELLTGLGSRVDRRYV